MPEVDNPLFTLTEVAEYLSVSTRTVQRLIKRGDLTGTKVGRQMRISRYALDQLLRKGRSQRPASNDSDHTSLF